jgi:flagellar biosynthesis/type III secretory pathway M-ring protein FliF/YscJ
MTLLIRFILVSIIFYLLIRSFVRYFEEKDTGTRDQEQNRENKPKSKGVSKEIGEYIDYEDVD